MNRIKKNDSMPAQLKVYEMEKRDLIIEVQRLSRQEKLSNTQIKNLLNISYRRIRRYLSGDDAELLCRDGRSSHEVPSSVSLYHAKIVELIKEDVAYKEIYIKIKDLGFTGSYSALASYCLKHFGRKNGNGAVKGAYDECFHYFNRKDIFAHIWSDTPMDTYDKQYIFTIFPDLFKLKDFIYEFKKAINGKNPDAISRWVDNVILSESFSSLISLANGMKRDIEPIKNSIIYTATNAFLEGNVNRLKMIKRTMYGRAGYDLLRSKVVELTSFY